MAATGPPADRAVTVYLSGGQTPVWTLTARDAEQVADTVRAFWDNPAQFPDRDRVLAFGPGAVVTTHLPLAHVIGLDVTPVEGSTP